MFNFLTDPAWVGIIVAAFGGLLAAVIPLIQIFIGRLRREITYKVISHASLVHEQAQGAVQVTLRDGTQIPDADFLVFSVKNTGNSIITKGDYIRDVTFRFPQQEIIYLTQVFTEPPGLADETDVAITHQGQTPGEVTLHRPELNKGDSVILGLLTKGTGTIDNITIEPRGGLRSGFVRPYRVQNGIPRSIVTIVVGILVILLALSGAYLRSFLGSLPHPTSNCVNGSIQIGGSTALLPLVDPLAQDYQTICPHAAITINQNVVASKDGLSALEGGKIQIADSDLASTNVGLADHSIAAVIYVMIVNSDVTVTDLSTDSIRGIYNGSIANWRQVGGSDEPIIVVNRTSTSGTRATFERYILGQNLPNYPLSLSNPRYSEQGTSGLMAQKVAGTNGAIGFVDLSDFRAMQPNLKALTINGIQASPDHVKDSTYSFWTIEHMYTRGDASDLTNAFVAYMTGVSLTSETDRKNELDQLIRNLSYIPIDDISSVISGHPSPSGP